MWFVTNDGIVHIHKDELVVKAVHDTVDGALSIITDLERNFTRIADEEQKIGMVQILQVLDSAREHAEAYKATIR